MKALTLEWIKKAEADFSDAHADKLRHDEALHSTVQGDELAPLTRPGYPS